ncbi:MarR family transcriptional regulator [Patescibacteria group bacterium]|nr:MarR family transcriptional regulator [Patescibacteria group bacterium]
MLTNSPSVQASDINELMATTRQIFRILNKRNGVSLEDRVATILQREVLRYIEESKNASMGEIAEHFRMSLSSMTQLIGRLAKSGFVARRNDANDRRIVRIAITDKGRQEMVRLAEKRREKFRKMFSLVPASDLRTLLRIHREIVQKLVIEERGGI